MKTILLLKRLENSPLFTENDVAKVVNKSPKYIRTLLYRLQGRGLIRRVEKGKYTLHSDPLIFSSYIVTPSYLSLWTALRYYNMTAQQPYGIFVMSPVTRKSIKIDASTITFAATNHMFGYKRERYGDFDIHLAEPEKAVVDALLFKLPVEDIKLALENEELDFSRMAEYATRTGNISLIKRLGYLLESRTGSSYGLAPMDRNYVPLDYLGRPKGRKNRKWRLIVKR